MKKLAQLIWMMFLFLSCYISLRLFVEFNEFQSMVISLLAVNLDATININK